VAVICGSMNQHVTVLPRLGTLSHSHSLKRSFHTESYPFNFNATSPGYPFFHKDARLLRISLIYWRLEAASLEYLTISVQYNNPRSSMASRNDNETRPFTYENIVTVVTTEKDKAQRNFFHWPWFIKSLETSIPVDLRKCTISQSDYCMLHGFHQG
jgi:hypothetical protein